jgi:hypothetical protein
MNDELEKLSRAYFAMGVTCMICQMTIIPYGLRLLGW